MEMRIKKVLMFSGHDTTIATILNTLGVFEYHCPPYTSTVLFELHKNLSTNSFYVNMFYKNSSDAMKLQLPGCNVDCPLDEFNSILNEYSLSPAEWQHECNLGLPAETFKTWMMFTLVISLVLIATSLLLYWIIIWICRCAEKRENYLRLPNDEFIENA